MRLLFSRKKRLKSFIVGVVAGDGAQQLNLCLPFILYPPTTPQSVLSDVAQRLPVTGVFVLRGLCGLKRRTPLTGESERVLPQSGHSTRATSLISHRLRSMATSIPENVHLGEMLV